VIQHQERLSHHRSLRRSRWRGTPRQQARPSRGSGGSSKAGGKASRTCIIRVSNVESQSDAAKEARACKSTITPTAPPAGAATHDEPQHKCVRAGALLALQSRRAIQKIVSNRAQTAGTAGAPSAADARGADMFTVDTQLLFTTTHIARV
jgi:hypothetical protein